jgi:electron transfer flavoprotein alpha subunit
MGILVIAEHEAGALKSATLNTVTAALEIAGHTGDSTVDVLVAGQDCRAAADAAAAVAGVGRVFLAEDAALEHSLAESLAPLIAARAEGYSHVLAPATTFGKNVLPRAAALMDVQQISDISAVLNAATFVRPIYAGNALATVRSNDPVKLITVRTTAFEPAATGGGNATVEPVDAAAAADIGLSRFLGQDLTTSERPELTTAKIVISGGRGMQAGENFAMLERIADKLGAAVGASRAAVDAGYVPNDYQVGQTGKVVAPDLYIAVGISGAIQHLAGMKDSKVIVAINKDEEAPIFQVADYGLVADLFQALPELEEELAKPS